VVSLAQLAARVVFREEQLEATLGVLDDAGWRLREHMHALLAAAPLANAACVLGVVHALVANLQRYPVDRHSVWQCLARLGVRHAVDAELLVEALLRVDHHFAQVEPSVEDPVYVAVCVFVANAAANNTRVLPLCPDFFLRHTQFGRPVFFLLSSGFF
jgi:integrator complex subunit 4